MAQEEPLYDFPEPTQPSERNFKGHQRGEGSLKSISVLDRLLLTVPVWLQLSINPATALHILQREPPGTFLVRKSRTSQRNVLCVRLADDSVPSFVQQFGIREEHSSKTLSLETSAISFPDLPRLISFYCVSRDVLRFPLELPEAIARATSHKELESISHMGIEFWRSHLNIRGPREAPKPHKEKKPDTVASVLPAVAPQPGSALQPNPEEQLLTTPSPDTATKQSASSPTLFHEFCPITTRSPKELDCGSGQGALCFINPLFLQSQNPLSRRRMFKRSLKVRISTESSTLLSPPLAPPPPPPLMPKTRGKCKAQTPGQGAVHPSNGQAAQIDPTVQDTQHLTQRQDTPSEAQVQPPSEALHFQREMQEQDEAGVRGEEATAQLPAVMENLPDDSDYMQPSPMINFSNMLSLSPYLSPSVSSMAPPLFPKVSPSPSPHDSPSVSPHQSPSPSPKAPFSLSPYDSPSASPSLSPYQSPSPSPKASFSLSPFTSPSFPQLAEQAYHTPATPSRADQQRPEREAEEEAPGEAECKDEDETNGEVQTKREEEERGLVLQMNAASLNDTDSSFSSLEGAAETPPHSPHKQDDGKSL